MSVSESANRDISEVLVRYATGIDSREWELFRTCFTEDCAADYGAIGAWRGADEITEWMRVTHEPCGHTLHRLTNIVIDRDGGDLATARSYVDAFLIGPAGTGGVHAIGYYDDELTHTPDGWKISRRRFTSVHVETVPEGMSL